MKDFKMQSRNYGGRQRVGVRNEWVRRWKNVPPDGVLLDVGVVRNGCVEWNSASLTPHMARRLAAALVKAAKEAES